MTMTTTIGFFGLGNMGRPMALNLITAKHKLKVYDVIPESQSHLEKAGAIGASSVADACRGVETIISMLPSGKISKELYLGYSGKGGILKYADKETLLIDCSTISPKDSKDIATAAEREGFDDMIDAPVSGGVAGAVAATLTFIVGGTQKALERARPPLEKMGKNVFHAGPSGAGQMAKICNNMLLAIHMIGSAEALKLGDLGGLDPKVLSEILKNSSGDNWSLQKYNPYPGVMENVPASRDYRGGFGVDLMVKDLGLAAEASRQLHGDTPLGAHALDLYKKHQAAGPDNGKLDFSSIINALGVLNYGNRNNPHRDQGRNPLSQHQPPR